MKTLLKKTTLMITLISMFGFNFKAGDEIELEQFINARTNPNFTKQAKNIKTTLATGTTGKVSDIKRFHSGNYGIKLAITSGPNSGQSYWVYYNKKDPGMKLVDKAKKEIEPQAIEPEVLVEEKEQPKAELTEDTIGLKDPGDDALQSTGESLLTFQEKIDSLLRVPTSIDCDNFVERPQHELVEEKAPLLQERRQEIEPVVQEEPVLRFKEDPIPPRMNQTTQSSNGYITPERVRPETPFSSLRCRGSGLGYDACLNTNNTSEKMEEFRIQNYGPNKIVKTNEYYINRSYEFSFPDRASSDAKLLLVDSPSDRTSHTTYNIMLFFPRTVQPTVERIGNELLVTLPNKEVIKYDATTKEIIGGVLSEEPMAQASNGKAVPAKVKYTGSNVMIRASKSGDLPYGDIETRNGSMAPSTTIATVSKKGHKDCKIPSKDIWYNDSQLKDVLIKPELATDEGLDVFIKKRCGFSLF